MHGGEMGRRGDAWRGGEEERGCMEGRWGGEEMHGEEMHGEEVRRRGDAWRGDGEERGCMEGR